MEVAVVAPTLFLFVLGCVELSRFNMIRHAADNAAYEAARHVIVPGGSVAEAEQHALAALGAAGVNTATITVEPTEIEETTPTVTVTVDVPASANSWGVLWFSKNQVVSRRCTLFCERAPAVIAAEIPTSAPQP